MFTAFSIVCNANLCIELNIRHHIDMFDRWVIIEGAAHPGRRSAGDGEFLTDGKPNSTDGTVETLHKLEQEFPKLKVIYATNTWQDKVAMCDEVLKHAEPGYLWEFDYDEFYMLDTIKTIQEHLRQHPQITDVEFRARHFWGDTAHHCPVEGNAWGNDMGWRRVFKFTGKEKWITHEPPRLYPPGGGGRSPYTGRSLRQPPEVLMSRDETKAIGLLFHYSQVVRQQVIYKDVFWNRPSSLKVWDDWQINKPLQIPGVANLEYYDGPHPVKFPV